MTAFAGGRLDVKGSMLLMTMATECNNIGAMLQLWVVFGLGSMGFTSLNMPRWKCHGYRKLL